MRPLDLARRHLRVKVIALIVAILAVGFGLLVVLNIHHEGKVLVANHQQTARLLAASITQSIESGMLEGRPDIIRRLAHDLREQLKDVRRLEVYRRNGVEAFTDLETVREVDRVAGLESGMMERIARMQRAPGARIDHPLFARAVASLVPQETEEVLDGNRVLTLFVPLRNRQPCQECHGTDHQVRGVVRISLGLDQLDAELRTARLRQAGVALLTILAVMGALVVSMGRLVLHGGRWTFTASGPTTNLAARIAGLTRGGEVMVGPTTAERIRGHYVLEDAGEHSLKNVAAPVRVCRLVPAGIYTRIER